MGEPSNERGQMSLMGAMVTPRPTHNPNALMIANAAFPCVCGGWWVDGCVVGVGVVGGGCVGVGVWWWV